MPSVNDWAAKAARVIRGHVLANANIKHGCTVREERVAAIIALHAEPLAALLADQYDAVLTDSDFGCVSWQAKAGNPRNP